MAPKQETPSKVTKRAPKTPKTPTKQTPIKDNDMKRMLLFLWVCFKTSNAHANIPALAEQLGIKHNAAQMRFTRMKKKLEEMEASEGGVSPTQLKTQVKAESEAKDPFGSDDEADADADIEDSDYDGAKMKCKAEDSF